VRTVAQTEILASKTKILVVSLVGIASLITAPREDSEMARKTIAIGTGVVTGIAKENGIVITGIETENETETGNEIERGNETETVIVVMTRIVTGTLERNATILPPAVRFLLLHSGLMTVVF
jgi:hypothetical protein